MPTQIPKTKIIELSHRRRSQIYAEAATREECDELGYKVAGLVYDQAGGTGGKPKEFL